MTQQQARGAEPTVVLWWIPVGAGSAISPHTSRAWERIDAALHHRPAQQLLHAGLQITTTSGEVTVIEMTPAWQMPRHVWGRHTHGVADMWNSNSVVSWLLTTCGVDATNLGPPAGSRAPGWDVGIVCARMRHSAS